MMIIRFARYYIGGVVDSLECEEKKKSSDKVTALCIYL